MDHNIMPELVSFKGYENDMNPLLDMIIDNITNNNSLLPSDEEIESAKSESIHQIEYVYDFGQITSKRRDISIQNVHDYFNNSIKILKSHENHSSRILESAQIMKETKRCPKYVLMQMCNSFDFAKICQYIELIKCIIDDLGLAPEFKYLAQIESEDIDISEEE